MNVPDRPAYHLYQWLWSGLDWFYPPHCAGCGGVGARWCADCQAKVDLISPPICDLCGKRMTQSERCGVCRAHPPRFKALRSWAGFGGPLRNALHRLKYKRDIALGGILAYPLGQFLLQTGWQPDVIIPVPLSAGRLAARGYNQAAFLARPLALATGLPYKPGWLQKQRETPTQVGLTVDQRKKNVSGAFQAAGRVVQASTILLVDDVATSGATLDACAGALLEAGAGQVYCLTLARAL